MPTAKDIALGIVIGGAVSASFGKSMNVVGKTVEELKQKGEKAKIWQNVIADTIRLQQEFRQAHLAGSTAADGIRAKIEKNNIALKQAGFNVDKLAEHYSQLGRVVRGVDLRIKGRQNIDEGKEQLTNALKVGAVSAVPIKIAADYQAIVRDIAIKGNFANTSQEREMTTGIRESSAKNGISRDDLAGAINQLVSGGMDAKEAMSYADLIGKFSVGQGSTPEETAKMIRAISQNAQIKDSAGMSKALEAVAYLGQAGNFESPDMAKAFPGLLAEMQKLGILGQESVTQLGAMLQVQMKVTGSADEAANNLKNWFSKIGSEETQKNYEKAGFDYESSMKANIKNGWSPLEASFAMAKRYIEQVDPAKADELKKFAASVDKISDPDKRQAQIKAFEDVMKTGDLFNDMQVKAALTAYTQNSELYDKLKKEAGQSNGLLDKNLAERREISKRRWAEVGNAMSDALETIGDALRPLSDAIASAFASVTRFTNQVLKISPATTSVVASVGAGVAALAAVIGAWKIGKGAFDIARGTLMGNGPGLMATIASKLPGKVGDIAGKAGDLLTGVQRVFVVNMPGAGMGGIDLPGTAKSGPATKTGTISGIGAAAAGVLGAGKAALAAPTLGAIAAGGAGTIAAAGGMVTAAGGAGYLIGSVINAGINKAVSLATGRETSLGSWLYEKLNPEKEDIAFRKKPQASNLAVGTIRRTEPDVINSIATLNKSADVSKPNLPMPTNFDTQKTLSPTVLKRPAEPNITFSPSIQVTVQGDVKDPRQLANELMPHLRRMFDEFRARSARTAMYDAAYP